MSKFVECVVIATAILIGTSVITYFARLSRHRGGSVSRGKQFREAFELRMIILVMLIPMFYLGFHEFSLSWLFWTILAVAYYAALYAYISNARKRARRLQGDGTT
jgi:Ca2+/Na+ antiporter